MTCRKISLIILSVIAVCFADAPYPSDISSNSVVNTYPASSPVYTKWEGEPDQSFSVQSGYEGYLVPTEPPFTFADLLRTAGVLTILPPLSKIGVKLALKFGIWALGFLSLFLVGSLVTTTVCSFTPLCTISFLGFGFNRESMRSLLSQDRLNTTYKFLADALTKYRELNKKEDIKDKAE